MGFLDEKCECSKCCEVHLTYNLHCIDFGREDKYPSMLDGVYVSFKLCDPCFRAFDKKCPKDSNDVSVFPDEYLYNFIKTFPLEHQEPIFNSGCNTYLSSEDWIRDERGELSDIEKREYGMIV